MAAGEEDCSKISKLRTPSPDPNATALNPQTPQGQIGNAFSLPTDDSDSDSDSESHQLFYTPFVVNENSISEGFLEPDSKARYLRFSKEAKRWLVGPMPAQEFNREFLPMTEAAKRKRMPPPKDAFKKIPIGTSKEKEIYAVIVSLYGFVLLIKTNILWVSSAKLSTNTSDAQDSFL